MSIRINGQVIASATDITDYSKKAGDETLSGVKTFSSSPIIPTPAYTDNSTNAANTEWIRNNIAPAGSVMIWAGTTVPTGYLLCDGSEVSRTTYSDLFSAIGTTYGVGDGSSTFNLPNFTKERIIIETYKSGNSWYHVYSDGWCEQGGVATGIPTFTISFLKPFRDVNYTLTTTAQTGNGDYTTRTMEPILGQILASSCTLQSCPSFNGTVFYWQACGYITLSTTTITNQHIIKY